MTAPTETLKHCPGVESLALPAHDLPPTGENFSANKSLRDGLAVRCRRCDGAYGKAWLAAKKEGRKFSARLEPLQEPATGGPAPATPPEPAGFPVSAARGLRAAAGALAGRPTPTMYHDQLAVRAERGRAPGYTAETVGGVIYALPDGATASTPDGQAALQVVNEARSTERKRRDAERKRTERAAKKAATA